MISYHCDGCHKGLSENEVRLSNDTYTQITGNAFLPQDFFCTSCLENIHEWWIDALPSKLEELRESNDRQIKNFRKAYFKGLKVVLSESQTVTELSRTQVKSL